MKKYIILLVLVLVTSVGFSQDSTRIKVIDRVAYELQLSNEQVQLIDVRTPEEFKEGHIKGAENIDFLAEGFLPKFERFDKNKPLYIYCRSGNRSAKAAAKLSEMGFSQIIDLKGGYKAWTSQE